MKTPKEAPTTFSKRVEDFLTVYAPNSLGTSENTLISYSYTFVLYLEFREKKDHIDPDNFDLKDFTADSVDAFLDWLESERNCKTVTRNQRLSAFHAFCKYLCRKEVRLLNQWQQIISIKEKKHAVKKVVDYLTVDETSALLKSINTTATNGERDELMLTMLYDTAARVQELADLRFADITLITKDTSIVRLTGKGNKTRNVPISIRTYEMLKPYFESCGKKSSMDSLFVNRNGEKLTRHGISYILKKYASIAEETCPSIKRKDISPHILRHSKAVHMLQGGVDLSKIRDFLGHEHISTTEIYVRTLDTDLRVALATNKNNASSGDIPSWHKDPGVMERLRGFGKKKK
jgi:Site-specific recombinase XerD